MASTGFLLARVGGESRRRWAQSLGTLGLRPSHYSVLMALAELGPISQRSLSDVIGADPRNVVGLVDLLEERGLLERGRDPDDRRRHGVRLTAAGVDTLTRLRRVGAAVEEEFLSALDEAERTRLHELLLKLLPAAASGKSGEAEADDPAGS
jgi:DNA-binding MarR family transcriptional regulator